MKGSFKSKLVEYVKSPKFQRHIFDWLAAAVLVVYFFFVAEKAKPFSRQFKLNDSSIQHPFSHHERVTATECLLLAGGVPLATILVVVALRFSHNKWFGDKTLSRNQALHLVHVSVLALIIALAADGVFTDIIKNWVARARPDFLERCGAPDDTDTDVFVTIDVCTAPLGDKELWDGMRSTPSGHSLISFTGLTYLVLWLLGQFRLLNGEKPHAIYKYVGACLPWFLAFWIALSRVQDYRHHFFDVVLGGIIGNCFAFAVYRKYFRSLFSTRCLSPTDDVEDAGLPLYTSPGQGPVNQ